LPPIRRAIGIEAYRSTARCDPALDVERRPGCSPVRSQLIPTTSRRYRTADAFERFRSSIRGACGGAAIGKPRVFCPAPTSGCWRAHLPQGEFFASSQRDPQRIKTHTGSACAPLRNHRDRAGALRASACGRSHNFWSDDGSSSVSLPEVPLLPSCRDLGLRYQPTSARCGLDRATFSAPPKKHQGQTRCEWRLVDEITPPPGLRPSSRRAREFRRRAEDRRGGVALTSLERSPRPGRPRLQVCLGRIRPRARVATITVRGPIRRLRSRPKNVHQGTAFWPSRWRANWTTPSWIFVSTSST